MPKILITAALALSVSPAIAHASTAVACGFQGAAIPVGTPIQELTISHGVQPTMGFGGMQAAVTSASVVAPPCHGTLTVTHTPLGFRYAPAPGFFGLDMYAVQGCLRPGRCTITGAVVTVKP